MAIDISIPYHYPKRETHVDEKCGTWFNAEYRPMAYLLALCGNISPEKIVLLPLMAFDDL